MSGGKNPMLSDSNAPSVPKLGLPSGNQNTKDECGYKGEGSMPLSSKNWTDTGPTELSGGK